MGKMIEKWTKAGHLLAVEGCMPSALGAFASSALTQNARERNLLLDRARACAARPSEPS